jgi:hypothetical protein
MQLGPTPRVHADLAPASTLPATHEQGAAALTRSALASASASWMRSPARHGPTIKAAQPTAVRTVAGRAHGGDDLLALRRIGGIPDALVARRPAVMKTGHRRRRSASTGAVKSQDVV